MKRKALPTLLFILATTSGCGDDSAPKIVQEAQADEVQGAPTQQQCQPIFSCTAEINISTCNDGSGSGGEEACPVESNDIENVCNFDSPTFEFCSDDPNDVVIVSEGNTITADNNGETGTASNALPEGVARLVRRGEARVVYGVVTGFDGPVLYWRKLP